MIMKWFKTKQVIPQTFGERHSFCMSNVGIATKNLKFNNNLD